MVSSQEQSKGCLVTFVERKTRLYGALPMEARTKKSMFNTISSLHKTLTNKLIKIITSNRGKECSYYPKVKKDVELPVYFADAYAAWHRGSNENSNGLLHACFLKETELAKVTLDELIEALMLISNRPRKCLDLKILFDIFKHQIRKLI